MFFSVIVPVYNAAGYLKECIDSIMEQSFRDFELILVDDGSTDESGKICDAYAQKEGSVMAIHQKNSGQTRARKAGLKRASGRYVIYVDADDWIDRDMLRSAENIIKQYQVEVVSFALAFHYGSGRTAAVKEPVPEGVYEKAALKQKIYPKILMDDHFRHMSYTVGKVVERGLMEKCQVKVNPGLRQGEDAALSVYLYAKAGSLYVSERQMYHYRIAGQSVSNSFRLEMYGQIEQTVRYFENLSFREIPDFQEQVHRYTMMVLFSILLMAVEKGAGRDLKRIREGMGSDCFRRHIRQAKIVGITPKTRLTFLFFKAGRISTAYYFLKICSVIKERWVRK